MGDAAMLQGNAQVQCNWCLRWYAWDDADAWASKVLRMFKSFTMQFVLDRSTRCRQCGEDARVANLEKQQRDRPVNCEADQCTVCEKVLDSSNCSRSQKGKKRGDRRCIVCADQHSHDCQKEELHNQGKIAKVSSA